MIYYDPSESRRGTRLQQEIIDVGEPLENLELLTGSDLLVTPYTGNINIPKPFIEKINENSSEIISRINKNTPMEIASDIEVPLPAVLAVDRFWQACQYGILIQRKSGSDFTSSIPKLGEIIGRMLLWTPDPWLLIAADIKCNRDGKAVIDGKESAFTHKQIVASKMSWMFSGGNVIEISRDNLTSHVVEYAQRKLHDLAKEPTKFVVRRKWTRQNIVGPNDSRWEWMNVLINFPGIGQKRAKALADYAGNLANAIEFLSDPDAVKKLGNNDIARVSDSEKFRKLLGFDKENGSSNKMVVIGEYKDD